MADSFSDLPSESTPAPTTSADVEMAEGTTTAGTTTAGADDAGADLPFAQGGGMDEDDAPAPAPRVTFAQHLATPVVTLLVGGETILTAHQGLLVQSPFFREACDEFAEDGSAGPLLSAFPL